MAIAGILLAAGIAIISHRLRWLTAGGAFAQFILGSLLFGLGGIPWAVPILVFFLSSSLLSILFRSRRGDAEKHYAKQSRRDAAQVLANGGVGGLLVLIMSLFELPQAYGAYVTACAAAAADTWATEIGTAFPGLPRMIVGFARVERGRSGAVSFPGSVAAFAGSVAVALPALPWASGVSEWGFLIVTVFGGLAGSLVDSLLGATVQGQWTCQMCGATVEKPLHCGKNADPAAGYAFVTNDLVNLLAIAVAAGAAWGALSALL